MKPIAPSAPFNERGCEGERLDFFKNRPRRFGFAVLPLADDSRDHLDCPTKGTLAQSILSHRFENPFGGGGDSQWVAAEIAHQFWPESSNRCDLIPFPTLILLANGALLIGGLILSDGSEQTLTTKMLPESSRIEIESFTSEISEPQ